MNPAYLQSRFTTELPASGLPEQFAIMTAQNPNGIQASEKFNQQALEKLRSALESAELLFFPINGTCPAFDSAEEGFGVACTLEGGIELGRQFNQEGIWWVDHGRVFLVDCATGATEYAAEWSAMADKG